MHCVFLVVNATKLFGERILWEFEVIENGVGEEEEGGIWTYKKVTKALLMAKRM